MPMEDADIRALQERRVEDGALVYVIRCWT